MLILWRPITGLWQVYNKTYIFLSKLHPTNRVYTWWYWQFESLQKSIYYISYFNCTATISCTVSNRFRDSSKQSNLVRDLKYEGLKGDFVPTHTHPWKAFSHYWTDQMRTRYWVLRRISDLEGEHSDAVFHGADHSDAVVTGSISSSFLTLSSLYAQLSSAPARGADQRSWSIW